MKQGTEIEWHIWEEKRNPVGWSGVDKGESRNAASNVGRVGGSQGTIRNLDSTLIAGEPLEGFEQGTGVI